MRIGSRCAPEAEVDATGIERLERSELLGDHERRVVGKHDAPRTHPYGPRLRCDMGYEDAGRRGADARHVVVLGVPDSLVAELLGALRDGYTRTERIARRLARTDDREIRGATEERIDLS